MTFSLSELYDKMHTKHSMIWQYPLTRFTHQFYLLRKMCFYTIFPNLAALTRDSYPLGKHVFSMNKFTYQYPVKQYFGKGCLEEAMAAELPNTGKTVMLAYDGVSLKRTGLYDRIRSILEQAGKTVVDFGGIMPNPAYGKVQEGARCVKEHGVDFILAAGGGSVRDCCKIISAQSQTDEDI